MEPDRSKKADDADQEKAESATGGIPQGATGENVEPIVLPVVLMPAEQSQTGEIAAEAARTADSPPADRQQPMVAGDGPAQIQPGPEVVAPDVRDLVDRLRPRREFELPLPSQTDDGSKEDDLMMEEAIGHFVSLAQDRMRELNLGEPKSGAHAIGTDVRPSAGDIERGILRHDANRGTVRQLSDLPADGESSGVGGRSSIPSGPAIVAGETPNGESATTMPRLQIVVQMADARAMYAEAIEEALEKKAPAYREIAQSEVKHGLWQEENKRRAADWRLRR
jgi:hypothetical protein